MSNDGQLISSTGALILARGVNGFGLLLLNISVSRVLGQSLFGVYAFITTIVLTASFLADFGLDLLLIREGGKQPAKLNPYLRNALGLKLVTVTVTLVFLLSIFRFASLPALTERLLWLYSLSLLFSSIVRTLWHGGDALGYFRSHAMLWAGGNGLKAVLGVSALLIWSDLRTMILGLLAAELITLVATWPWAVKNYGPLRPSFCPSLWRWMTRQAAPIALGSSLSILYLRLDVVFLEVLKGETSVGLYSAAAKLVEALSIVPTSIGLVLLPQIAEKGLTVGWWETARRYLGAAAGVGFALGGGLFVFSEPLVFWIYGAEFAAAAEVLQILALGTGMLFVLPIFSSILIGCGSAKLNALVLLAGLICCAGLQYVWIPQHDIAGAACAVVVSQFLLTLLYAGSLWILRRSQEGRRESLR